MVEFNRKSRLRKYIHSLPALVLLLVILLLLLKAVWGVYEKERKSSENLDRARNEYLKIVAREKELRDAVDYLKTDKGIEAEIRTKFRAVREGESVAVIIDEEATSTAAVVEEAGLWGKIKLFFGM
jgi:cell division protein FtsB